MELSATVSQAERTNQTCVPENRLVGSRVAAAVALTATVTASLLGQFLPLTVWYD